MSRLIPAFEQFFDNAGKPLVSGLIDFFEAGSSTIRKDTFADSAETKLNPNPVELTGAGRAPNIFGTGSYRAISRDSAGSQILQRDPVGGDALLPFGGDWSPSQIYSITDVVRDGGDYWESLVNNNLNNKPSTDDGTNWQEAIVSIGDVTDNSGRVFATVAAMKVPVNLISGQYVSTIDFAATVNGGGAKYLIQTAAEFGGTPDEFGDHTLANGNVAVLQPKNNRVTALQFGADATGVVNATPSLHAMFAAMIASKWQGVIEPGTYLQGFGLASVVASDSNTYFPAAFDFADVNDFTLYGYGAIITADPTMPDNEFNRGFYFLRCSNTTIFGLKYDGRLDARTPFGGDAFNGGDPLLSNRKHGFGFYGCTSSKLIDCKATRTMMDGIFVGRAVAADGGAVSEYGSADDCINTFNFRQGMSCVSASFFRVNGGEYTDTGRLGASKGTPPMAGIDIEADPTQPANTGVVVTGARMNRNDTGIAFSTNAKSCKALGCDINDNGFYAVLFSTTAQNCTVDTTRMTQLNTSTESEQWIVIDNGINNTVENSYMEVDANNDGLLAASSNDGGNYDNNEIIDSSTPGEDTTKKLVIIDAKSDNVSFTKNKVKDAAATSNKYAVEVLSPSAIVHDNRITSIHGDAGAWGMVVRAAMMVTKNFLVGHKTTLGKQINVSVTTLTDTTGDTDGSTGVITGMADTSAFAVGAFVTVSAGFPAGNIQIASIDSATQITVDVNSNSVQSNVTVTQVGPIRMFKDNIDVQNIKNGMAFQSSDDVLYPDFAAGNHTWDGNHIKFGSYSLWVDATGDLRIKSSLPTSDTDGTVVGTQT